MNKLTLDSVKEKLAGVLQQLNRYKVVLFVVFVTVVYGLMLFRIETLNSIQPSTDQVAAENNPIKAARVDKKVVDQLQALQDNSVNVQSLFQQARNNPFQE
jgi:hypothetical protein